MDVFGKEGFRIGFRRASGSARKLDKLGLAAL